jgi:hypothetical protein
MMLSNISTELLIKMREHFLSGRTRFFASEGGPSHPKAPAWIRETMIEAVEDELRRRLN